MDNNENTEISEGLINACITTLSLIFAVILAGSIGLYIFLTPIKNIKTNQEINVMGVISMIVLFFGFSIAVAIIINKYCISCSVPNIRLNIRPNLDEIVVEDDYSI